MGRDLISVARPFLRSRGPSGPPRRGESGKQRRGKAEPGPERPAPEGQERETQHNRVEWGAEAKPYAEPGPERPATQWQERETKAKRMRPPGFNDQRGLLRRGPSGLPRSGKSGKTIASTTVEPNGLLSVRFLLSVS